MSEATSPAAAAQRVKCIGCGWRSRRKWDPCDCIDPCSHSPYGACLKCGRAMYPPETLRRWAGLDAEATA